MMGRRIFTWGILCVLLVAGIVYAFWPRPVLVDLALVKRGPLIVSADEEGETRVRDVFVVSSSVTGRLRRIESDVGDQVIAGKTVVANIEPIDPSLLDVRSEAEAKAAVQAAQAAKALSKARLLEAKAELDFASAELTRARRLIRNITITERALDEAERTFRTRTAAVATIEAELKMRDSELAKARARLVSPIETQKLRGACACIPVIAPVSGRILRLIRESEGVVAAGDPLIEIGDPRDLEIVVDFLSTDAVKIAPGQRVIIEEWGGDEPLTGRVRRVEPYGFTKVSALGIEEQRVNVIIDFADPPARWQRLGHGFRVEVKVVLWESGKAMRLPLTALFRDGKQWTVFVNEDGRARRRAIEIGRGNGLHVEIKGGLSEDEQVILHPSDRVSDGVRIGRRTLSP
jgi:HlyD family secretion protein